MANKKRFSIEEEVQIVKEYERVEKISFSKLARKWDCSPATIREVLKKNKVQIKSYYLTTEQELRIISDYQKKKLPMSVVARKHGISASLVCLILARNKISARDAHLSNMKYELNEQKFDGELDEYQKYWLGFIMGDGCILKNRITVELSRIDRQHLVKLKEFLESTHPVKDYEPSQRNPSGSSKLEWYSPNMVQTLKNYGIVPSKSSIDVTVPMILAQSRDFWRGMVDSDGSVKITITKEGYEMPRLSLVGTENLMDLFLTFIQTHTDTKTKVRRGNGKMLYRVTLEGKPARKIIPVLYGECRVSLERKNETAKSIMENFIPIDEEAEKQMYLQLRLQGIGRSKALRSIGRSYKTLDNWLMKDPEFSSNEWRIIQYSEGKHKIIKHPLSNEDRLDEKVEKYFSFREQGIGRSRSAKMAHFSYKTIIKMIHTDHEFAEQEEKYSSSE